MNAQTHPLTCLNASSSKCAQCAVNGGLDCSFSPLTLMFFWLPIFIFFLAAGYGMVEAGYQIYILAYLAIFAFIYLVGAPGFLCRHCPYYGEEGFFIKCGAHYGSIKLWKYSPTPLNKFEKFCVHAAFIPLFGFPLVALAMAGQWFCLSIAALSVLKWGVDMAKVTCARCVNLECPMNRVPQHTASAYKSTSKFGVISQE